MSLSNAAKSVVGGASPGSLDTRSTCRSAGGKRKESGKGSARPPGLCACHELHCRRQVLKRVQLPFVQEQGKPAELFGSNSGSRVGVSGATLASPQPSSSIPTGKAPHPPLHSPSGSPPLAAAGSAHRTQRRRPGGCAGTWSLLGCWGLRGLVGRSERVQGRASTGTHSGLMFRLK